MRREERQNLWHQTEGGGGQGVLLTLPNITHDAQKERRERLKQKYGGKTQLPSTGDTPLQRQSRDGRVAKAKTLSWSWGNPCKVSKDQKTAALIQHETRRDGRGSGGICVCVFVNMQDSCIQ